jgi:transcriptional regulator of acetoin/glycerol metabolism
MDRQDLDYLNDLHSAYIEHAKNAFEIDCPINLVQEVEGFKRHLIIWAIEKTHGNISQMAHLLGVKRTTIHGYLQDSEIKWILQEARSRFR